MRLILIATVILSLFCVCFGSLEGVLPEDTKTFEFPSVVLIKGGTVVNYDRMVKADVLVQGDKIVQIAEHIDVTDSNVKVIDATGKYVMPGGIAHVHLALPFMGTVSKDDFYHGSRAALSGGTTMVIDFAIPAKGQSYIDIVNDYKRKGSQLSCMDYSLHVGIVNMNDEVKAEMKELVEKHGINSFKMFMAYKNVFQLDDQSLYDAFVTAKNLGAISMVHAENGELVVKGQERMAQLGIFGPEGHPMSRPKNVEAEATHRAAEIAFQAGNAPLYVVHVMSKDAMEEIARAKAKGYNIVGEAVAPGIVLDESVYFEGDWAKRAHNVMSPPIRSKEDQLGLVNGLKSGVLSLVGTDHCVFNSTQKEMGLKDFRKIPNGVNGLEDRMSLLFDKLVVKGVISPSDYVRITSTEAAQIFNIYPRKGAVQVGSDADIIVLNPNASRTISAKTHHQNIDYNVYEGMTVRGTIDATLSQGRVVFENGKLICIPGSGRFVPNPPYGKLFETVANWDVENAPKPVA